MTAVVDTLTAVDVVGGGRRWNLPDATFVRLPGTVVRCYWNTGAMSDHAPELGDFLDRLAAVYADYVDHGKTIRPSALDVVNVIGACAHFGGSAARAGFYLLTGRYNPNGGTA